MYMVLKNTTFTRCDNWGFSLRAKSICNVINVSRANKQDEAIDHVSTCCNLLCVSLARTSTFKNYKQLIFVKNRKLINFTLT